MNFNNSSSQYGYQNQTRNRTTTLNHAVSGQQFLTDNKLLSFFIHYKFVILIILSLLTLSLLILIFLLISKRPRKEQKKIQRKRPVPKRPFPKRPFESKSDPVESKSDPDKSKSNPDDDPWAVLFNKNGGDDESDIAIIPKSDPDDDTRTVLLENNGSSDGSNLHIIINDDICDTIVERKPTDSSLDTSSDSTLALSSQDTPTENPANGTIDNDDLSELDLEDCLPHIESLNNNPIDSCPPQNPDPSLHNSYKNPYIAEYEEQKIEEDQRRKERRRPPISINSMTSEESCL